MSDQIRDMIKIGSGLLSLTSLFLICIMSVVLSVISWDNPGLKWDRVFWSFTFIGISYTVSSFIFYLICNCPDSKK